MAALRRGASGVTTASDGYLMRSPYLARTDHYRAHGSAETIRSRRARRLSIEPLERRDLLAADLVITEFMASNRSTLTDAAGETPDWIEIHNRGDATAELADWALTDDPDNLGKWKFPDVSLPPDGYLVVFASGTDRSVAGEELHTNFKLRAPGETVALVAPNGVVASRFGRDGDAYPPQVPDISYGVTPEGDRYFAIPTPGQANGEGRIGFVAPARISVAHGFFDAPFQVVMASETPGTTIHYTTDGSVPTETHGRVATGPLTIDRTTVLRAAAFKADYIPSRVETRTYIFLRDVVHQPSDPDGFPATWGGTPADYGMDPNVVDVAPYSERMFEGLKAIPTMSLVLENADFFGPDGIYSHPLERGRSWERPVSVEYFDAGGDRTFQIDAGLRIHGGSARDPTITPQHSLRLHFRGEYGAPVLDFPLFGDSEVTRFDSLVVNAQSSDNWTSANLQTGAAAQFMRDQWAQDMQREMGHEHVPGSYVHLYINGLYWGMYGLMERPDASFAAAHFGGRPEDYDVIVDRVAKQGDLDAWTELFRRVRARDYPAVLELLDIDNYIDYMILNMYMGNWDWPDHNWQAVRGRADGERFTFLVWDAEVGLGLDVNVPGPIAPRVLDVDLTGPRMDVGGSNLINGPGEIYNRLRKVPEFQLRFADRLQKHLFDGGALTPERAAAVYAARADEIEEALLGEAARWGDVRREPPDVPDGTWLAEKEWILGTFFPQRGEILLDDFRNVELYPSTAAPRFNQHGGFVPRGFNLLVANGNEAGDVYYTTDGSDPRVSLLTLDSVEGLRMAVDFNATPDATFAVDVPDGRYEVLLTHGDFSRVRDETQVSLEGTPVGGPLLRTEVGEIVTRTHSVDVTDGQLTIRIQDLGGATSRSVLAGMVVRSAQLPADLQFDFGTPESPVEPGFIAVHAEDRYSPESGYGWLGGAEPTISSQDRSETVVIISPKARKYDGPIVLSESSDIKARAVVDGEWSALSGARFTLVDPGDLDLNGQVDRRDIDALVLGLTRPRLYEATYEVAPFVAGDMDGDGDLDVDDIAEFVAIVGP